MLRGFLLFAIVCLFHPIALIADEPVDTSGEDPWLPIEEETRSSQTELMQVLNRVQVSNRGKPATPIKDAGRSVQEPPADADPFVDDAQVLPQQVSQADWVVEHSQSNQNGVGRQIEFASADGNWGVTIFGALAGEMIYADERPIIPSGIVLISPDFGGDRSTFDVHAKQSRLGAALRGPDIWGFQSGGLLLTYFYGEDFLDDEIGFFITRAYGELRNHDWRFVFGIDADVINPLNPGTLDFNAGGGAGNLGYFREQLRVERFVHLHEETQVTAQVALSNPVQTSFDNSVQRLVEDNGGPNLEGRVALGLGCLMNVHGEIKRPFEVGVSGLTGEVRRAGRRGPERDVWAIGADLRLALTNGIGIQGELFHGEAVGNYLGGITQIVNPFTFDAVRTTGGWGEVYVYWADDLHSHFGYGVDHPDEDDLSPGLPSRNAFAFANLIFDVTSNFEVGFEIGRWDTEYVRNSRFDDNDAMVYRTRVQLKF